MPQELLGVFIAQSLPHERQNYLQETGQQEVPKTSVLLTWQGPWGCLFQLDPIPTDDKEVESLLPRVKAKCNMLWTDFLEQGRLWAHAHKARNYAQSLELCCQTLKTTGQVRVHLHAWFHFCDARKATQQEFLYPHEFKFKNTTPVPSSFLFSGVGGIRSRNAGAFYLSAPKIGAIKSFSSLQMFQDYSPMPSWITAMVGGLKMNFTDAEDLYAKCISGAKFNIEQIRYVNSYWMQKRREEERLLVELKIRANQRPFKKIDDVDTWLKQYAEIRDRYLFLVLDGDSQFGKTRFAANLTTADRFFLVDCSSATEPELRLFDRDQHDVVCFDEAKPSMIIRAKKLVQAGVDMARLGQSATNQVSYQVWFHRVKLVVCCNGWDEQVRKMPSEDAAWLKKNSVYVKVTEPLFE